MRKKWLGISLLIVVIAALSALIWNSARPVEPRYEGKRISVWLETFGPSCMPVSTEQYNKAKEAVLKTGTNALPYYLACLEGKDSQFKIKLMDLADEFSEKHHLLNCNYYFYNHFSAEIKQSYAYMALDILKTEARPATPTLTKLLYEGDQGEKSAAALLLAEVGPDNISILTNALSSADDQVRVSAAKGLGGYGNHGEFFIDGSTPPKPKPPEVLAANAKIIIPFLIQSLNDTNQLVRCCALYSLGNFSEDNFAAKTAIPVLAGYLRDKDSQLRIFARQSLQWYAEGGSSAAIEVLAGLLKDTNAQLRCEALETLANCESKAKSAVPDILKALQEPDPQVRIQAAKALRQIDSEAAAKAGAE